MIKKLITAITITLCIVAAILLLDIYFAGVTLVVQNESNQRIDNAQIGYGRGSFWIASLQNNERVKKSLGKIGEGADFQVQWRDNSGLNKKEFNVYFSGHSGYHTVKIIILPDGDAILVEGGRQYKST